MFEVILYSRLIYTVSLFVFDWNTFTPRLRWCTICETLYFSFFTTIVEPSEIISWEKRPNPNKIVTQTMFCIKGCLDCSQSHFKNRHWSWQISLNLRWRLLICIFSNISRTFCLFGTFFRHFSSFKADKFW